MRKITFDEEELFAIAVFEPGSRQETAARMTGVLEALAEDPDMHALIVSASEKLKKISDREFEELAVDGYREELAWEEEEDPDAAPAPVDPGVKNRGDDGVHDDGPAASRNADGAVPETGKDSGQVEDTAGGGT